MKNATNNNIESRKNHLENRIAFLNDEVEAAIADGDYKRVDILCEKRHAAEMSLRKVEKALVQASKNIATVKIFRKDIDALETLGFDAYPIFRGKACDTHTAGAIVATAGIKKTATVGYFGIDDEAALDEVFDLTNNPARFDEKTKLGLPTVSCGDLVLFKSVFWFCAADGWIKVDEVAPVMVASVSYL